MCLLINFSCLALAYPICLVLQVGVNKDSYLVLDKLPAEYDARVKAMEVDERPTEEYSDVGGLDKQIQELIEAIGALESSQGAEESTLSGNQSLL